MKRILAAVVLLLLLALAGAAWVAWDLYRPHRGFAGSVMLEIAPGTGAPAIADLLVARGVIAHKFPFLVRYRIGRRHNHLKAGEYLFDRPSSAIDVYRRIIRGDVYLYPVVIPEGSDRFDIARILSDRMAINPDDFLRLTEQTSPIHDLDPEAPSLEGYLFPDTYRFPRHVTAGTVIATMLARFRHVLQTQLRQEMATGSGNLHDVVTLASLVEKETPDPAERPIVAGVFTRRLEKGMPLPCPQSDWPHPPKRSEFRFSFQYLSPGRIAAGADCQPGRNLAARRLPPGRRRCAVFRGQQSRRSFFCPDAGRTSAQRGEVQKGIGCVAAQVPGQT